MKLKKNKINKILTLRATGLNYSEISRKLKINLSSVRYYCDPKVKEYNKNYMKNRYKTDPEFRKRVIEKNVECKKVMMKTPKFRKKSKIWRCDN